jgi:asparagine synthase (glutamine-hydrolysing)
LGIDPRHPFTDVRLLEFSLAIPPSQQLADGYTRSILRRSLGDLLPEKIQWRPWKTPLDEGFQNALSQESRRIERLLSAPGRLQRYVDIEAVRDLYEQLDDGSTSPYFRPLWQALSLHMWIESERRGVEVDNADNIATNK